MHLAQPVCHRSCLRNAQPHRDGASHPAAGGEEVADVRLGGRLERNASELRELLANPAVHEVPIDGDVARVYAEITAALRRAGTPLPTNDIWIAATAAATGSTVLTYDGHFREIARVGSLVLSV